MEMPDSGPVDEGPVRVAGGAVHGPGQHRGGIYGYGPVDGHPEGDRDGQRQRVGGVRLKKAKRRLSKDCDS